MRSRTKNSRRVFGERSRCGSGTQQVLDMSTQRYGITQRCRCQRRARRVALSSCGRAERDRRITHPRSYMLHANPKRRTSRSTSEPDHMGKNKKRGQPLWKWSDDCTQCVGCFRTGCRGWLSSGNDANVCFTTATRALLVWPTWTWLRKLFSRNTLGAGKQRQTRTLLSSPFFSVNVHAAGDWS